MTEEGTLKYERVVMFSHRAEQAASLFTVAQTESGMTLKASSGHYVWRAAAPLQQTGHGQELISQMGMHSKSFNSIMASFQV